MSTSKESLLPYANLYRSTVSRKWFKLACVLIVASFLLLALFYNRDLEGSQTGWQTTTSPAEGSLLELELHSPVHEEEPEPQKQNAVVEQEQDSLDPLVVLKGAPTTHFRDNLRPDVKYISSWPDAGWTNDVMTYANLIYLGLITERVPILPMFYPSHIGYDKQPIAFSDVFDIDRMRKSIGKPIVEWKDVKDPKSEALDTLGCWNIWETVQNQSPEPRHSNSLAHLKLDISYTKTPDWVKSFRQWPHDTHTSFWTLARFAFPETRDSNLVTPRPSPNNQVSLPPDDHLLCFDYLYYVCADQPFEWDTDYSPSWRYVARYMYWTSSLQNLADQYVRRTFGVAYSDPTPPYITVHVRHGDFANNCILDYKIPVEDCFAKIPVYARRVEEVKAEILEKRGIVVNHVIMTSDERDEGWWKEVEEQGWLAVDHSQTKELYGDWYPILIDAVIQSGGVGFVGTYGSTMSILAKRRVMEWHDGASRMVRWGTPNADDH
ncbi:hypothetical protein K435DRAFT_833398 [Dendrothele bispora CBS 962.96]|uniref:GDP-fucose protein O-fucosyltransferase 2 n=1 Tax=Dendrothele bispora (strain CBS 962.96) TaxID=1314807 RepID=A0A4S8MWS9_DENBC|nr:hypothetical protein K435DRAFT_833398 [Dendrothele bispora CBS 962.96]